MLRPAVFLDRDGVINEPVLRDGKPYPPESVRDVILTPGAETALQRLTLHGFVLLVVTNQPDVRRGTCRREEVEDIHKLLSERLPLRGFYVCYHDDIDGCHCRKPLPGLLLVAAVVHNVDLNRSYLIGDRWRDIDAGRAAGCRTVLIDRGYKDRPPEFPPDATVRSITEATDWILSQSPV